MQYAPPKPSLIFYFFAGGSDEKTGELMAAIKAYKK